MLDNRKKIVSLKQDKFGHYKTKRLEKYNASSKQEDDLLKKQQGFLAKEHENDSDSASDIGRTSEQAIYATGRTPHVAATMLSSIGYDHNRELKIKTNCNYHPNTC